jgi:hypothetical protein
VGPRSRACGADQGDRCALLAGHDRAPCRLRLVYLVFLRLLNLLLLLGGYATKSQCCVAESDDQDSLGRIGRSSQRVWAIRHPQRWILSSLRSTCSFYVSEIALPTALAQRCTQVRLLCRAREATSPAAAQQGSGMEPQDAWRVPRGMIAGRDSATALSDLVAACGVTRVAGS